MPTTNEKKDPRRSITPPPPVGGTATVSPTRSVKSSGSLASPTRFVEEEDLAPPPKQPHAVIGLRLRADSDGSTNNAFFRKGHPPLPVSQMATAAAVDDSTGNKKKTKKKKKKRERPMATVDIEGGGGNNNMLQDEFDRYHDKQLEQLRVEVDKQDSAAWLGADEPGLLPDFGEEKFHRMMMMDDQQHRQSSRADESLRFSEVSGSSLYGAGLLDTTRSGDLMRESSSSFSQFRTSDRFQPSVQQIREGGDAGVKASHKRSQLQKHKLLYTLSNDYSDVDEEDQEEFESPKSGDKSDSGAAWDKAMWAQHLKNVLDPSPWLIADVKFNKQGTPYFEEADGWTAAGWVRHFLYNPICPEFTSLQQFWWAVLIGIAMGVYTAVWKLLIESGVDLVWDAIPMRLLEWGAFTELDGAFPLYHYMWLCPAIMGGLLSYIFAVLPVPIPGQNEWIQNLHARGVQDARTLVPLFCLATLGMLSGLSLGPELPLVLTAGMMGSWLGLTCQQSMLQARVLNLTAASAAVGGFFGFPMAGALFVLEIPHRMGLQYFEALNPATIASIIAVVTNRIITGNDVTGYFKYPFLSNSLPSQIFTHAILYGLYGAGIGIVYAFGVMKLKGSVHDWFHKPHDHHHEGDEDEREDEFDDNGSLDYHQHHHHDSERRPLVDKNRGQNYRTDSNQPPTVMKQTSGRKNKGFLGRCRASIKAAGSFVIPHEPTRAAVAGCIASALCGVVAMFVPHTLFWGEAQLQNLIDKGRTPLPVFDAKESDLTALGLCMIDPEDPEAVQAGFSMQCSLLLMVSKTIVIGLSLGTGIVGGHFWGPLFIGCAASHFLGDLMNLIQDYFGFGGSLAAYPCLIILCTMGAAHVVTFRAHTAIMLILTLTISSFTPENNNYYLSMFSGVAGDYSAVFPLLVISVFVSQMVSRQSIVFYKEQRSRGDITAVPEVLCEPGMEGRPLVATYDPMDDGDDNHEAGDDDDDLSPGDVPVTESPKEPAVASASPSNYRAVTAEITQEDIEKAFSLENSLSRGSGTHGSVGSREGFNFETVQSSSSTKQASPAAAPKKTADVGSAFSRLDELLSAPISGPGANDDNPRGSPNSLESTKSRSKRSHRRTQSAPVIPQGVDPHLRLSLRMLERKDSAKNRFDSPTPVDSTGNRERSNSRGSVVMRVESYGELHEHQPPLLEQARLRAASRELVTEKQVKQHRRSPSQSDCPVTAARASPVDLEPPQQHRRSRSLSGSHRGSGGIVDGVLSNASSTDSGVMRGRHSRQNSATGETGLPVDAMVALSLDEIEDSFNAAFVNSVLPKST